MLMIFFVIRKIKHKDEVNTCNTNILCWWDNFKIALLPKFFINFIMKEKKPFQTLLVFFAIQYMSHFLLNLCLGPIEVSFQEPVFCMG